MEKILNELDAVRLEEFGQTGFFNIDRVRSVHFKQTQPERVEIKQQFQFVQSARSTDFEVWLHLERNGKRDHVFPMAEKTVSVEELMTYEIANSELWTELLDIEALTFRLTVVFWNPSQRTRVVRQFFFQIALAELEDIQNELCA